MSEQPFTAGPRPDLKTPAFGDIVENGWASEDNPTRRGYFVRAFRRTGRMNAGLKWEITDGKGKFWELMPLGDHRISVSPTPLAAAPAMYEALKLAREFAASEVEMREHAGGTMSDYINEAQEVVDAIDAALPSSLDDEASA